MKKHAKISVATMLICTMLSTGNLIPVQAANIGTGGTGVTTEATGTNTNTGTTNTTGTSTTNTTGTGTTNTTGTGTGTATPAGTGTGTTTPTGTGTTTPATSPAPANITPATPARGAGTTGTNRSSVNNNTATNGMDYFQGQIAEFVRNKIISQATADRMMNYLSTRHQGVKSNKNNMDAMSGTVRFEQNADGSVICAVKKPSGDTVYFEQKADGSASYYEKTLENVLGVNSTDLYSEMAKQGILTDTELTAINNYSK